MRSVAAPRAIAFAISLAALPLGCRDLLGIDERAVGSGGGTGTGEASSSSAATGTGGEDPSSHCNLALFSTVPVPACATCLRSGASSCCSEIDACSADPACRACLSPDGACAVPPPTVAALAACVRGSCGDECYPTPEVLPDVQIAPGDLSPASDACLPDSASFGCNPMVQSVTCGFEWGTTCNLTPRNTLPNAVGFACYLSARRHVGESCGLVEGQCHFGLTCANYVCARMCCTDSDCNGGTGHCDPAWMDWKFEGSAPERFGICVVGDGDGGGDASGANP